VAAQAIAQEQVTAAALANLAVATGRQQRIAAEQANSAVVVEQIEAALEAAAARFKASIVVGARRGAPASAVARAGRAAEVAVDPVVEEAAEAADKKVSSRECRVKRSHVYFPVLTLDPRPSTLLTY
jgi:hypothetical protein